MRVRKLNKKSAIVERKRKYSKRAKRKVEVDQDLINTSLHCKICSADLYKRTKVSSLAFCLDCGYTLTL